jgi:hypothetical protein
VGDLEGILDRLRGRTGRRLGGTTGIGVAGSDGAGACAEYSTGRRSP